MTTSAVRLAAAALALASWECATVQSLNPRLTESESEQLWAAIVANRDAPSASAFAEAVEPLVRGATEAIIHAVRTAVENLERLLTAASAAAPE